MLAELKYDVDGNARRVGLVFIDAHGDFNVPETTPSFNLYPDGVSRQSAFNLIEGAIRALQAR